VFVVALFGRAGLSLLRAGQAIADATAARTTMPDEAAI
jgi:hypothetical protein